MKFLKHLLDVNPLYIINFLVIIYVAIIQGSLHFKVNNIREDYQILDLKILALEQDLQDEINDLEALIIK